MGDQTFVCPACAQTTRDLLATAGCSAGHALCPDCAAQWFSTCSRCPLCNADVQCVSVHLLSACVVEADPQEMLRSIQERSLEKAVFTIRPQTKLQNYITEEEAIANLPLDLCQVCNTETSEVRCNSCGDVYHRECAGLNRSPASCWCCSRCDGIDGAASDRQAREGTRRANQVQASDSSGDGPSLTRTRPYTVASVSLTDTPRRPISSGPAARNASTRQNASVGSPGPASQKESLRVDIQMGILCEASMKRAVSCLHALRDRHRRLDLDRQQRPRVRHRRPVNSSQAQASSKSVHQHSSAASARTAFFRAKRHPRTMPQKTQHPQVQASASNAGRSTLLAHRISHSSTCTTAADAPPCDTVPMSTYAAPRPAIPGTCATANSRSGPRHPAPQVQGAWLPSENPCKRGVFVPHASPGPQDSYMRSACTATAAKRLLYKGDAMEHAAGSTGCPNAVTMMHTSLVMAPKSGAPNASAHSSSNEGVGQDIIKRRRQHDADEPGCHIKMVRPWHPASLDKTACDDACQGSARSLRDSTCTAAQARMSPSFTQDKIPWRSEAAAATRRATFSRKLMKKAFECFAFKGALPKEALESSADAAATALSACIATASHPIKGCDAQRFSSDVMEQHSLIFTDESQNAATRYVKKELLKFSLSESSRLCSTC